MTVEITAETRRTSVSPTKSRFRKAFSRPSQFLRIVTIKPLNCCFCSTTCLTDEVHLLTALVELHCEFEECMETSSKRCKWCGTRLCDLCYEKDYVTCKFR